jgi:membrane associated rhomboid family serine protease
MPHAIVQLFVVGVYCIISVIITITEGGDTGVSNASHGFGALAGLLIGICVLVNVRTQNWEKKLSLISITIVITLTMIGICSLFFKE